MYPNYLTAGGSLASRDLNRPLGGRHDRRRLPDSHSKATGPLSLHEGTTHTWEAVPADICSESCSSYKHSPPSNDSASDQFFGAGIPAKLRRALDTRITFLSLRATIAFDPYPASSRNSQRPTVFSE